jgi:hypothetical protein
MRSGALGEQNELAGLVEAAGRQASSFSDYMKNYHIVILAWRCYSSLSPLRLILLILHS